MRAYAPKLLLMSIFGTIALDIFCVRPHPPSFTYVLSLIPFLSTTQSIGTLFPTARYTILNSLLISVSSYTAIALVVTVLVFPVSMNHSVLHGACDMLAGVRRLLEMQDLVLEGGGARKETLDEIKDKRAAVFVGLQQCQFSVFPGWEFPVDDELYAMQ